MTSGLWPLLCCALAAASSACTSECGPSTCAAGCCEANICYEGAGGSNGQACASVNLTPAGGTDAGGGTCSHYSCSASGERCCAADTEGNALTCSAGTCQTTCVDFNSPCNASIRCCQRTTGKYNNTCVSERCDLCINRLQECTQESSATPCCAGTTCQLRSGFSTIYECR